MLSDRYEEAYNVLRKHFDSSPKDSYWEDVDLWVDMSLASYQTHRCLEAVASAWHVLMRTEEGTFSNDLATAVFSDAAKDSECIDKETYIKE